MDLCILASESEAKKVEEAAAAAGAAADVTAAATPIVEKLDLILEQLRGLEKRQDAMEKKINIIEDKAGCSIM